MYAYQERTVTAAAPAVIVDIRQAVDTRFGLGGYIKPSARVLVEVRQASEAAFGTQFPVDPDMPLNLALFGEYLMIRLTRDVADSEVEILMGVPSHARL